MSEHDVPRPSEAPRATDAAPGSNEAEAVPALPRWRFLASSTTGLARTRLRMVGLIVLAALLAHATVLGSVLAFDDTHTVRDNVHLRSIGNLWRALYDPTLYSQRDMVMYRPSVVVTLILDHAIGFGAAWVSHLVDLLLHAATACLVFALALQFRIRASGALLGALVFAVHPLATAAIHFVNARSDQLAACALLAAMVVHLRTRVLPGTRAALATWPSAILVAIACGAKETAVVAPLALFASDWALARARGRRPAWTTWLWRVTPSFGVVVGWLLVRRAVLGRATAAVPQLTRAAAEGGVVDLHAGARRDLTTQLATMFGDVLPTFAGQMLVPFGLSVDRVVDYAASPVSIAFLCGAGALSLASGWAIWTGLRRREPGRVVVVGLAWVASAPWILIPLNSPALEHRVYLPLALLAVALASLVRRPRPGVARRSAVAVAAAVVVVFAGWSTARGSAFWSEQALWRATLETTPRSRQALVGLGVVELTEAYRRAQASGSRDELVRGQLVARTWFERACWNWPRHKATLEALIELELALDGAGRPFLALALADRIVEIRPRDPFARLTRSRALTACARALGEDAHAAALFDHAVAAALSCLEIAEAKGLVYRHAARARIEQGDYAAALELLDESVARGLDDADVLLDRAEVYARLGDNEAARADLVTVRAREPFHPGLMGFVRRFAASPPR
jgi:hypothetical protein